MADGVSIIIWVYGVGVDLGSLLGAKLLTHFCEV